MTLIQLAEIFNCNYSEFYEALYIKVQDKCEQYDCLLPKADLHHPLIATLAMIELDAHHFEAGLNQLSGAHPRITFINKCTDLDFCWASASLKRQTNQLKDDLSEDPLVTLGSKYSSAAEDNVKEAMTIIKKILPIAHEELEKIVTHIVWFDAPSFWSGSDPGAFGALFVNPALNCSVPHMVETLLHESGHLHLMIEQAMDPLVLNPKDRVKSPLRKDPRPIIGVLHATFVLLRMCICLKLYVSYGTDLPDQDIAIDLFETRIVNFNEGVKTLEEHAAFTKKGELLMESIIYQMKRL